MWQEFEDNDGKPAFRAVLDGYLVFLNSFQNTWFVNILMPEDEREKTFMAGPGFKKGVTLEEAKCIAAGITQQARTKLNRKANRRAQ